MTANQQTANDHRYAMPIDPETGETTTVGFLDEPGEPDGAASSQDDSDSYIESRGFSSTASGCTYDERNDFPDGDEDPEEMEFDDDTIG